MTEINTIQVYDASGTVDLSDGTNTRFISYTPQVSAGMEPIRETLTVHFLAAGTTTNVTNLNSLNRLFMQARESQANDGIDRVYIQLDPGKTGTNYRARLYDGAVNMRQQTLAYHMIRGMFIWDIEWVRDPYWEGPLTQIPLTNSAGTDDTSGLAVYNAFDAAGDNWVSIAGTAVSGDLPAPIKVEMYNAYSSAQPADEIRMYHNVWSTPGSLDHILEAEDATGGTLTATAEGTPGASAGSYAAIQWAGTTETKIATWALSSSELGYANNGMFALVARFNVAFPYTDCWLRLKQESAAGVLDQGRLAIVPDTRELQYLDTMRFPPSSVGTGTPKSFNLNLYALRETDGTHTLNLDFIQLSPVSLDSGWLNFIGSDGAQGIAYQEYFIHDATEGFDWRLDTSGNSIPELTAYGGPILLEPNQNQRLYFLTSDSNGSALVEQNWTVKMWYRPRRNSL